MPLVNDKLFSDGGQDVAVPAHLNFGKFIFDRIRRTGDEVALHNATTGEKLTYKNLTQHAVDLSVGFTKLGIGMRDVVLLGIDHRILFVPTALAVIFTGATVSPTCMNTGKAILKHRLTVVPPTYLICTGAFWEMYGEVLEEVKTIKGIITFDNMPESAITVNSLLSEHYDIEMFGPAEVRGQDDAAVIYYSSGTTGFPKAIQLTHLNCILHCLPDDYKSLETAFHFGLWGSNYTAFKTFKFLAGAKKIVYCQSETVVGFLDTVEKHKVDIAFLYPGMIYDLVNSKDTVKKHNVTSLKIIYSRSSPLHAKTIVEVKDMFSNDVEVYQGYGMTECGELSSEIRGTKGPKSGSVGIPSRGIILKIVDLQTGESLPANRKGEICVKGGAVMKGYVNVDRSTYCDEEGYFKTGDLGYFDEDGYFYIIDRLKEILIVTGYNVAPIELETLLQLHPGVREAGVVGKPGPKFEDLPTAFIVREPGSNVTEQELQEYVAAQVATYMQLTGGVRFISELPRNARGKILRRQLREMLSMDNTD